MATSEREIFGLTGPSFLTFVDWNNFHHRRSIVASLVKGVYTMERDRLENRQGPQALAPPWYEFFNFKVHEVLIDPRDDSYFGVIYEFNFQHPHHHYLGQRHPQYVIAFRGTIKTSIEDLKLDARCILNDLENSFRFRKGLQLVQEIVLANNIDPRNIWLAGHSLGSAIALLIGKHIVKQRKVHLETYLFNPPFISPPIEWITNDKLKLSLMFANSVLTAILAIAVKGCQSAQDDKAFIALSSWIPYLFINPSDIICSKYINDFEHRENMESIGYYAGKIGSLATRHSMGSIFSAVRGKDYDPMHLIPSGYVTVNLGPRQRFKDAHGIHQWWRQDLQLKYNFYQYK